MMSPLVTVFDFSFNIYGAVLLVVAAVFIFALWTADKTHKLDWTWMITKDGKRVSTTKILQIVGGIVGTWVLVQVTMSGKMTWDLLAIYLGYVASVEGFSKLVAAKYAAAGGDHGRGGYGSYGGYGRSYDYGDKVVDEEGDVVEEATSVEERRRRLRKKLKETP